MSDKDPEEHTLAVRMPLTMVRQLDARAKYLRGKLGYSVSRSDVARNLIKDGLKRDGAKKETKK